MLKKIISMATAAVLMAGGISVIATPAASATADVTQFQINLTGAPTHNMPKTAMSINNPGLLTQEWQVSAPVWSPAVASTFDSNTVYVATVTLTANFGYAFNNLSANAFSFVGAGAAGATDSSTAVAVGANASTVVVEITFPITTVMNNNNNNLQMSATTVISNITETSADVDFSTLAAAHPSVTTWHARLFQLVGLTSTFINSRDALGSAHTVALTGLTAGTTYRIFFGDPNHAQGVDYGYEPSNVFTTLGSGSTPSTPTVDTAAIAAAAAKAAAAVVAAKTSIVESLKSGKTITVSDLSAADIRVASEKAAARVNTKLLALPVEKRADIAAVAAIVRTENFVDKVSSAATQVQVTTRDLVTEQLLAVDYKYKASVLRAVLAKDPSALDSIEKVDAVVKAAIATVQARKDRLAALIAKISGITVK
jgi:hypothetical protein